MLVSIITPSYNQADFLEATIQSVLSQDYPNIEYIVIDGESTDGSQDIIQRYASRLAYWVSEKDKGQTDALNKGFARAHGDVYAWLNSDDTYQPGAVREAVEFLQAHPDMGMAYGNANYINAKSKVIGQFPAAQTNYRLLRRGYVHIPQQSSFFRGDLWKSVGPLDPSFYFAMDYDLWVRIAAVAPVIYVHRIWANFRLHSNAKTVTADERCWSEMLRIHRRDGGSIYSIIYAKYLLRKLLAPFILYCRRRMVERGSGT
jgi:glycosyltransferase involved in cell wall biosynthesis